MLHIFTAEQLAYENEPAGRSTLLIAEALNSALTVSSNPAGTLEAFVNTLSTSNADAIKFKQADAPAAKRGTRSGKVPDWFVHLLTLPDVSRHAAILVRGQHIGDLLFEPDMAADIYEKWVGFLTIVVAGTSLMLLTVTITFFTVDTALRPLRELGQGLARLRAGRYAHKITCSGPPEIMESCDAANELAETLTHLDRENRTLMRKMVSIQDDERRDIARELHDELGPLLFAIRANVVAMADSGGAEQGASNSPPQKVLQSVEALQSTNRRILDRLSPMHNEELGLESSIRKLLRNMRSESAVSVELEIDPAIKAVDRLVSQTVYRVLQEAVTNVLRHSQATEMKLSAAVSDGIVSVEVSDNGVGMPEDFAIGRGLTGMRERVRALLGTFELSRDNGRTYVRCRLPFAPELEGSEPLGRPVPTRFAAPNEAGNSSPASPNGD